MGVLRRAWQLPLLLALIGGVLGMHVLMGPGMSGMAGCHGHPETAELSAASGAEQSMSISDPAGRTATVSATTGPAPADPACMPDVLHLCVAVLTTCLLMVVGAAALFVVRRAWSGDGPPPPAACPRPERPPPAHATRLAVLCVMRN